MKDKWFDLKEYEGLYQINVKGDIKSLERFNEKSGRAGRLYLERILKTHLGRNGYPQVVLHKNGKSKTFRVHRLVAKQFIQNPLNLPTVNHKDENKLNNHVDNLEWCTVEYNNNYNHRQLKIAEKRKKKIAKYDKFNNLITIYNSLKEATESVNGYKGYIINCCKGLKQDYKNYKWEYYEVNGCGCG